MAITLTISLFSRGEECLISNLTNQIKRMILRSNNTDELLYLTQANHSTTNRPTEPTLVTNFVK